MHIRVGYDFLYHCPQGTPMLLIVNIHYSRASDLVMPDYLTTDPSVPISAYRDPFGNWCHRLVAPAGQMRFTVAGWSETPASQTWWCPPLPSMRWRICRKRRSSSCGEPLL